MRWVSDGMVVFVRFGFGEVRYLRRGTVTCASGNHARVAVEGDDPERKAELWLRVDELISEEEVALDAARRLGAE